jgi:hypothetical protein
VARDSRPVTGAAEAIGVTVKRGRENCAGRAKAHASFRGYGSTFSTRNGSCALTSKSRHCGARTRGHERRLYTSQGKRRRLRTLSQQRRRCWRRETAAGELHGKLTRCRVPGESVFETETLAQARSLDYEDEDEGRGRLTAYCSPPLTQTGVAERISGAMASRGVISSR